jgi:hypothetical protein
LMKNRGPAKNAPEREPWLPDPSEVVEIIEVPGEGTIERTNIRDGQEELPPAKPLRKRTR